MSNGRMKTIVTGGMLIWKYDMSNKNNTNDDDDDGVGELSKFIKCSGLIGPGDVPDNSNDYVDAGSNGLEWGLER
jgi:hypothetical protein